MYSIQHYVRNFVSDLQQACAWFSPGTPISYNNKPDRNDIAEKLLKAVVNTILATLVRKVVDTNEHQRQSNFRLKHKFKKRNIACNIHHFVIECNKLTSSRSKLYSKVTEIVPYFWVMSDSDKFKYILSSNDYDIMKICVIGISEMCSERNKLHNSNAK